MSDPTPTLTEKVVKGSSVVLIFTLLGSPIGYFIRVLYSHSLSIEMFGLFYAALALFSLLSTYLDFGLGFSTAYFIPKFLKQKKYQSVAAVFHYCQMSQVSIAILAATILFFSADWLAAYYFKSPAATNLVYIFSIYLVANSIFTALNTLFLGIQQEVYYSSMQFLRLVFILGFSMLFWLFDVKDVIAYALTWASGTLLVVVIYYVLVLKKYSFIFQKPDWDKQLLKAMLSYGLPTLVTTSLYTFITSADVLFLTFFNGLKEVAIYNVVYPLATISSIFLSPISSLVLPLISHLMEGEEHKVSHLMPTILKLVPFISLYFGLFIALFPGAIVGNLFGYKWTGLVELPLTLFALGFALAPLSTLLVTILSGMGKVKERLNLSLVIVILNIVLSFLLVPHYGVVGVILANILVYIVSIWLCTRVLNRVFRLNYPFQFYFQLISFVVISFLLVKFLHINPTNWWQIMLVGIIYTTIFGLFGFTQKVVDPKIGNVLLARLKLLLAV